MPQIDTHRWKWITDREKAAGKALFERALAGMVPPKTQEEYQLMKTDPWRYVTEYVKQPPSPEEQAQTRQLIGEGGPAERVNPFRAEKSLEKASGFLKDYLDTSKMVLMTDEEKKAVKRVFGIKGEGD